MEQNIMLLEFITRLISLPLIPIFAGMVIELYYRNKNDYNSDSLNIELMYEDLEKAVDYVVYDYCFYQHKDTDNIDMDFIFSEIKKVLSEEVYQLFEEIENDFAHFLRLQVQYKITENKRRI